MDKKFKVLLVSNDINQETIYELAAPIGLCYLAGYADKYYPGKFEFVLKSNLDYPWKEEADIIGFSSMSRYFPQAVKIARELRETYKGPLLLGGSHISALPQTLPSEFDVGVIGEGEETFRELLGIFLEYGKFPTVELAKVRGIVRHSEGKPVINPPRPLIENLDEIPFPRRDLWDLSGDRIVWLSSSRGCPFNCVFCAVARTKHREFSAEYVAEELMMLKKNYHPRGISFHDDLFMLNQQRLEEIIRQLRLRGFGRDIGFGLSLRANFITPESVKLMKELNVITVFIGIESASPSGLNYLKSGSLKLDDVTRALKLLKDNRIMVEGAFIIGFPHETRQDLLDTYNFILDHYKAGEITFLITSLLTPFPGSRIWDYALERGQVSPEMDFSRLNMALHSFDPYNCTYLNDDIPLTEFVDYVDIFEDLHFSVNRTRYEMLKESFPDTFYKRRLDRERLRRFKSENSAAG